MAHRQRGVQEPYRRPQIPDPVEIATHFLFGCAAPRGRHLSISIVKRQSSRHRSRRVCSGFRPPPAFPHPHLRCATIPVPAETAGKQPRNFASARPLFMPDEDRSPEPPARIHRAPVPIPPRLTPSTTPSRNPCALQVRIRHHSEHAAFDFYLPVFGRRRICGPASRRPRQICLSRSSP
jgi:hypothetical protein